MIQNTLAKILLAPFSLLYGLGVSLRDFFYRKGLLKGVEFDLPIISVGNLSVGGAGKTPHIEYLIRLLQPSTRVDRIGREREIFSLRIESYWNDCYRCG